MPQSPLEVWLLAARPKTLWASCSPVIIGGALAYGDAAWHTPSFLAALVGAVLIQIGTNFANDYFDFAKGTDTADRVGPTRATQAGLVSPAAMKRAAWIVFLLTLVPGAYIIFRGGWPFLTIGLLSILFGVLYTGGPYPLGYLGLGDILVLIFFGPVAVGGTYYLQAMTIHPLVVVAGLAPGLFSVAILTVNNLRDLDGDRVAGKRTLAVRFGRTFARFEYLLSILIGGCAIPVYLCMEAGKHYYALISVVVAVLAIPAIKTVFTSSDGRALNDVLAATGKLLLVFSILLSIGWLL
ncbi:MAG: 1,4-dihydroxy-2-naphthoate polyprenyltransferase [Candidatus Hydrogenedentes bacterium]|nr:1,4-dihydroxy-2-naphthoate polyprenyltransferase [Candidatus Hydrogenedentota bacterium]